jgi:peptidyl-tRNA hydrolase, PTH2 family
LQSALDGRIVVPELKQIIVMRTDLNMRKGKMVAQGAHAAMKFLAESVLRGIPLQENQRRWLQGLSTKICVGVDSEANLIAIFDQANQAGLVVHKIVDAGKTEFAGVPTITCIAIGPDEASRVDAVTAELKLI